MKGLRYIKNIVTLNLDSVKCNGCSMCEKVCPHAVFAKKDKKYEIVDKDACMECGACAINCPQDAITVNSGVGCAAGIIAGALRGTEPTCDCSKDSGKSCC